MEFYRKGEGPVWKQEYLAQPNRCPFCKSENIEAQMFDSDGLTQAFQDVECKDCGREWRDHYKLVDVTTEEEES